MIGTNIFAKSESYIKIQKVEIKISSHCPIRTSLGYTGDINKRGRISVTSDFKKRIEITSMLPGKGLHVLEDGEAGAEEWVVGAPEVAGL